MLDNITQNPSGCATYEPALAADDVLQERGYGRISYRRVINARRLENILPQKVRRTPDTQTPAIQHVGADHRRRPVPMSPLASRMLPAGRARSSRASPRAEKRGSWTRSAA